MQSVPDLNPTAKILPDAGSPLDKKAQVAEMFNNIAGNYDFLNHFLSLGIDKGWRKKAIAEAGRNKPARILDVATGTADLAIAAAKLQPDSIVGIDIADQMLAVGREKINAQQLGHLIQLHVGDSEAIDFPDASFDAITCAYGVRNFGNLEAGLKEMFRVLRPGGKLVILEFSQPERFPMKQLYKFYFLYILPIIGRLFSKHSTAYTYLPESVQAFPQGKTFTAILEQCGFTQAVSKPLTFGITSLYTANK
ncbi:MAG: bifunctional demethylmenaquinone methyltransferase/2-methoxy-6-polyprenyl-1,4-benzoquinol methylase UbiE [Chitinophagia bacterium]|nr:bifunctional demethylmenaquinone methyltransferase/2-methoxy-6-polyprenyl-1,4-benzoquinol methylase UbiE [Chitinophagia bacterium]